jgi:hypothetical protein
MLGGMNSALWQQPCCGYAGLLVSCVVLCGGGDIAHGYDSLLWLFATSFNLVTCVSAAVEHEQ